MALASVTKYCPGCQAARTGKCFPRDRSRRDGLGEYCRLCMAERQRQSGKCAEWYAREENRAAAIERARQNRAIRKAQTGRTARPRPKGGFAHILAPGDRTACGCPSVSPRYTAYPAHQVPGGIRAETTCRRCAAVLNMINECPALTPDQVATAAKARSANILTRAARMGRK